MQAVGGGRVSGVMCRFTLLLLLAGCPAMPQYLNADVTSLGRPLPGALVAAECPGAGSAAQQTDEDGHARLELAANARAATCTVTIARPGFLTAETGGASLCSAPAACPALEVGLAPEAPAQELAR